MYPRTKKIEILNDKISNKEILNYNEAYEIFKHFKYYFNDYVYVESGKTFFHIIRPVEPNIVYEIIAYYDKDEVVEYLEKIVNGYYPFRVLLSKKDSMVTKYIDKDFKLYSILLAKEFGKIEYLI